MSAGGLSRTTSVWARRVMRAMLPIGIVLLVAWVLWLAAEIASGETQRGFSVVSAVLGLVTSLTIIANGWYYRRESARSR